MIFSFLKIFLMNKMSSNQTNSCCVYPQLALRTKYDQNMQDMYCPLAQEAYKNPVDALTFESYCRGARCSAGTGDNFRTVSNGYGISVTSPMYEGYCGCPSNKVNRMPVTIENYTSNCPAKNMSKNRPGFPGVL
jgi:hypothetical protein